MCEINFMYLFLFFFTKKKKLICRHVIFMEIIIIQFELFKILIILMITLLSYKLVYTSC